MAKGKGSSGSRGRNPSKPKKPQKKPDKKPQKQPDKKPPKQPDNKPPKKKHEGGSKIDFGDILKVVLSQLGGDKTSAPEPKPEPPSAPEPKPSKTSQAELKALLDLIKIELAKKTPDQALIITLLTKIQDGLAANDGEAGNLTADLADTLRKLKGQE